MTKLAPEWVRTSDPVIRSPARYRWTTACDPWDARTKLSLLPCSGHMQMGGVRVFYSFATMFWQRGCKNPYGYRTVHVRALCVLENTRIILRSLYVARAGADDGCECTYRFLAPSDCLRAFYGGKQICACTTFRHGLLTGMRGLYKLKKNIELRSGPCGPMLARAV